jgi:hypothetical protein
VGPAIRCHVGVPIAVPDNGTVSVDPKLLATCSVADTAALLAGVYVTLIVHEPPGCNVVTQLDVCANELAPAPLIATPEITNAAVPGFAITTGTDRLVTLINCPLTETEFGVAVINAPDGVPGVAPFAA